MLSIFIGQFQDNLIYLLMAAGILSVLVGFLPGHQPEYTEAAIIFLILLQTEHSVLYRITELKNQLRH